MRYLILFLLSLFSLAVTAQKTAHTVIKTDLVPAGITATISKNSVNLTAGKRLDYTAFTGYLNLQNDTGKQVAKIFFTYYRKDGEDASQRPVCFTFNGGPGSSSVWLHMGGLGPKRVLLQDDGTAPAPPYQIINNEYTWLDKTDLVFIDPVSTGFSVPAGAESAKQFHGFVEDVQSVGAFIRSFLSKYQRWASPKYLAGESYGTTRAAGLAKFLTDSYRIYINGILLISPVLNFGTNDIAIGNDLPFVLYIPSYTAAAWYHKKLAATLQGDLQKTLKESEDFAMNEYAPALLKGEWLGDAEKDRIAEKLSYYTGLSKVYILQANLRVSDSRFYKELRRKDGLSIGRLDSRFTGHNFDNAGEGVDYDPSFINIDGPFTSTMNDYFERDLNFNEEREYNIFGNVYPWNYNNVQNQYLNVAESLRDAMTKNTHLKVYIGSGYYDFATPYFTANYDVAHMFLEPDLRKNLRHYYYESGHMYYINKPSMIQFKKDVDNFFEWSNGLK
ncbi:carboxypeptidase [Ferruginibacter paludis]|uniref:S10 family peptidase n=1 Tax=Ferruginibacter paludis TaxID=1310417 RepID=UPI0025B424E9|nr:carboxypeptidase [Ferruginibacter paludis]MDN3656405.1 carboxypeptidase [Ferruginibacter paludis]